MNGSGLRYRTPADVRAIPNAQWERWLRGVDVFPGPLFSAEWSCQKTLRTILEATRRRLFAPGRDDWQLQGIRESV